MAFKSGKNASVRVGAGPTTIKIKKWAVDMKVAKLDVCNAESGGFGEYIGGVKDLDVTIEGDIDAGSDYYTAQLPGTLIATVKLYIDGTSGVYWDIPTLYVESFKSTAEVRGLIGFVVTGSASATFVDPAS